MQVIDWLLEEKNPAVRFRTLSELLGEKADPQPVVRWITNFLPGDWQMARGLWYVYYLTALAECGLTREVVEIDPSPVLELPEGRFDCGCADFLRLRALAMLGFADEVRMILGNLQDHQLPDGGFLCLHRVEKIEHVPKSCVKANTLALMCFAECNKRGVGVAACDALVDYFFKHGLFYRSHDPSQLMVDARPGWRFIDTFHPFETMRVGLHNTLEALCALGHGKDPRLQEAWDMLLAKQDTAGKVILEGTLTRSYLPKEKVGVSSKWVTFYTLLAQRECIQ